MLDGAERDLEASYPRVPHRGRHDDRSRVTAASADSADVGYYRDMLTIIRDQVKALIDEGLTLEQVIERRPTFGYEARFGKNTGAWTTNMFIEAVYRSLKENS